MKSRLLIFTLFLQLIAASQGKYTVFKTIGNIRYFSDKSKQWETLKPMDSISNDTKIRFIPHSSLIIFDSKYRIYEVTQNGDYLLKNTIHGIENNTSKEMQKAVKFFAEQTFAAHANGNTQKSKGAVYRGEEGLFPWDSTDIVEDTFTIIIKLPKGRYPVLLTLNDNRVLIYNDTNIRLASNHLKGKDYNELRIDKELIHLRNTQNASEMKSMRTLLNSKKTSNAAKYSILLEYCISKKYYSLAKYYLQTLKEQNRVGYEEVREAMKSNALINQMAAL